MTLPAAASHTGRMFTIKRLGGGNCTVAGVAALDGGPNIGLVAPGAGNSGNSITVQSDGTAWYLITMH